MLLKLSRSDKNLKIPKKKFVGKSFLRETARCGSNPWPFLKKSSRSSNLKII